MVELNSATATGSELLECSIASQDHGDLLLVLPVTFMNNSGAAVLEVLQRYDIRSEDLLIIVDDFQLPFGTLRMRSRGSDGGHNGLASVIDHLQSDLFPRLRIGVAGTTIPERHTHEAMADYVLGRFEDAEEKELPHVLAEVSKAVRSWCVDGIAKTMSKYNKNVFTLDSNSG
jgi:PTH1 family peptidyl-tRNA hydrolase